MPTTLAWLAIAVASPLAAQDFRLDTDVFIGTDKEPVAETLTLFSNSRAYDFMLTGSKEIVVFDRTRGEFTLIDEKNQFKAVVTTQQALDHAFAIKEQAVQNSNSLFAEAADPKFEETNENKLQNGQNVAYIKLAGKKMQYEANGVRPKFAGAVHEYSEFATWCARLNAMRAGNLPAEARIVLNRAMAGQGILPREITRTIQLSEGLTTKKSVVQSRHLVNWTLSGEDQKRIERAHDGMVNFKAVSFDEYCQRQAEGFKTAAK